MSEPQPLTILAEVARMLDELAIPYAVGGSYASSLYGEPRFTRDADLIVSLSADRAEGLAARLQSAFYVSREAMTEAVQQARTFNAIHSETGFKLDFFVVGPGSFDRSELERRVLQSLDPERGIQLWFKSPEDTLLRKLLWYRQGGETSDQQWRDVQGILLHMKGRLDESYLSIWAQVIGIADLLRRALEESENR